MNKLGGNVRVTFVSDKMKVQRDRKIEKYYTMFYFFHDPSQGQFQGHKMAQFWHKNCFLMV